MRSPRVALVCALLASSLCALAPAAAQAGTTPPSASCKPVADKPYLQDCTYRTSPITVDGYEVKQDVAVDPPRPDVDGSIVHMDVDVTDKSGTPIPINRLMLHHIVFSNVGRTIGEKHEDTCKDVLFWDNRTRLPMPGERFYAAGEERARLDLPPNYGYPVHAGDHWMMVYMLMNHRAQRDTAYITYHVTVDTRADLYPVKPIWMDVRNCQADPIYNVEGTGGKNSTTNEKYDFTMPYSARIVAGGGHVHGGGKELKLTEPSCGNRTLAESKPTWGLPSHPFYHVRPVLHEPGPINMSGFATPTGIPVAKGERIRLNSIYDDSLPHVRVMGIMVMFVAPDDSVTSKCGPLPTDVINRGSSIPGRKTPVPFTVPLTGLDSHGRAVRINAPPGKLVAVRSGSTISVGDLGNPFTGRRNVTLRKGAKLRWKFNGYLLHNVTLANGPEAIGSPNLDKNRTYTWKFRRAGTYRLFCALHPVAMTERVIVR